MTENTNNSNSNDLLDTKYGTIVADSIVEHPSKTEGKTYLTATLKTASKEVTVYANGDKFKDLLKATAEAGEPTFIMGSLMAKGKGISLSRTTPIEVKDAEVVAIKKDGTNARGPWALVELKGEGRDKNVVMMVSGEERVAKFAKGEKVGDLNVVYTAANVKGRWRSNAELAEDLISPPKAPKAELTEEQKAERAAAGRERALARDASRMIVVAGTTDEGATITNREGADVEVTKLGAEFEVTADNKADLAERFGVELDEGTKVQYAVFEAPEADETPEPA